MRVYEYTLPSGAQLTGYLRQPSETMPGYEVRPGVLILPGGAYAYCSPREADPVAMQFLQAGYQVFILEYTTTSRKQAPLRYAPLTDAAGAILHLRRNAESFCLDPDRLAICGFSAGGHLAASAALLTDCEPVCKALQAEPAQLMPNAVILGYPVITSGEFAHEGSIENLAGTDQELKEYFSLENQVKPGLPPFFVWHTVADQSVPVQNSMLLAQALEKCDVNYELHLFTHGDHGSSTCSREVGSPSTHNAAWLPLCIDWLADVFDFHL